jgi:magnesium-transporting ATPase (P-type)
MLDDSSIRQLPHEQPVSVVVAALGSNLQAGLTSQEAQKRQKLYGLDTLRLKAHVPAWKRLLGFRICFQACCGR